MVLWASPQGRQGSTVLKAPQSLMCFWALVVPPSSTEPHGVADGRSPFGSALEEVVDVP